MAQRDQSIAVLCLCLCALGAQGCSNLFRPPDTRVVGQTLGTLLAASYTASLMEHALRVGSSPCYDRLVSDRIDTGGLDMVTIAVGKECGFPFPGQAVGTISVVGFDPAGEIGFGVADFSSVRVDGRPLPITRVSGFLAVPPEEAATHCIGPLPSDDTLIEPYASPLVVIFADAQITPSPKSDQIDQGRIDEWFGVVDWKGTRDDFSDDSYWIGGQRATATPTLAEVAQEFVAFAAGCRRNPLSGFVQLVRASEIGKGPGVHYLIFGPECKGAGFVLVSVSKSFLSTGQRVPLDLLGQE